MSSTAITPALPSNGTPPALPDVNYETYPYDLVQHLLNQTADFNMYATPVPGHLASATLTPGHPEDFFGIDGGYGLDILCDLRRFDSTIHMPSVDMGVGATEQVGESSGRYRARWLFSATDLAWTPGQNPSPGIFDAWYSQRFNMLDCRFEFGNQEHPVNAFDAYGIGRTYPMMVHGRPVLLAAGVGNLMQGYGKFAGLEGTFVMTGTITPDLGFRGSITFRAVDPDGRIRTDDELGSLTSISDPDPSSTFMVMHGEKKNRNVKTTFGPPPGGGLVSLITPSQMRAAQFNFTASGHRGLKTSLQIGPHFGDMTATVFFNLLAPPGTAQKPVPFTTDELYTFLNSDGEIIATLTAGVVEGISFDLKFPAAPGQPGVRFAGFGPITGGTGPLAGARGMLTVNSLIGISPHALTLVHVLHLVDPDGSFRHA